MFPNRPLSRTTILAHAVDNRLTAEVRILLRRESRVLEEESSRAYVTRALM